MLKVLLEVCLLPQSPIQPASDPEFSGKLIKMGFATRRKMLRNNLGSAIAIDRLVSLLEEMGINPWLTDKTQTALTPTPLPELERGF
jgi:16S rRNA A1518/A1519 N6-dimethyltransferase RsmA/KsgA/DIM1 with predicted DNA glycosylase/AP lyase activity